MALARVENGRRLLLIGSSSVRFTSGVFDSLDDGVGDLRRSRFAQSSGREQLHDTLLGARDDGRRLRAGPLEGLLDLGPRRIRELGRLMASLLEKTGLAGFGLAQLLGRVAVRVGDELAGLGAGRCSGLVAQPLALVAETLDLGVLPLEVLLLLPDLLLGPLVLRRRGLLGVTLEDVGEVGGLADQMERVHPDCVPGRIDLGRRPAA